MVLRGAILVIYRCCLLLVYQIRGLEEVEEYLGFDLIEGIKITA